MNVSKMTQLSVSIHKIYFVELFVKNYLRCVRLYATGYHAGLWDNCQYNVTENSTLETCHDKLAR